LQRVVSLIKKLIKKFVTINDYIIVNETYFTIAVVKYENFLSKTKVFQIKKKKLWIKDNKEDNKIFMLIKSDET